MTEVGVRRAVSRLERADEKWPEELTDYSEGIRAMKELDAGNPLSLQFQAAIHGRDGEWNRQHPDWDWCQHQSWFFLPWHRMYLRQFEKIIGHLIDKPQWRLPYWDYTSDDQTTWRLPIEFTTPADESNHLWVDGRFDGELPSDHRDATTALSAQWFTTEGPGDNFGSGMIDRPAQFGTDGETGALEGSPHNIIHMDVGGLMGNPATAAMDPVFWLHHANIDRLWEEWIRRGRANPDDGAWLETSFEFPDPIDGRAPYRVKDVLVTRSLGYVYDDAPAATVAPDARGIAPAAMAGPPPEPEIAGASDGSVPLVPGSSASIRMVGPAPRGRGVAPQELPDREVFLRLEGVRGTDVGVGVYAIYVGVPEGDDPESHPELKAGLLATFGLEASSRPGGHGITQSLKITSIARHLREQGRWDPNELRVSFVEETPARGIAPETADDVAASRISVFYA